MFYVADLLGPARGAVEAMKDGEILMMENLRQYYDSGKANDETFRKLSRLSVISMSTMLFQIRTGRTLQ